MPSTHKPNNFFNVTLFALATRILLTQKDEQKAFKYFLKAMKNGCHDSKAVVGFYFEFGLGKLVAMYDLAEGLYISAAKRGSGMAAARLAFLKTHGRQGIKINHAEAEKWKLLGKKNRNTALVWTKLAAEHGLASAQFCLAICYYNGIVVEEDDTEAYYWCEKAALQDHAAAQNVLGNLCIEGAGCKANQGLGLQWYLKSAEKREPAAIYNIGTLFERGIAGVEQDENQAFDWYVRAAAYGSVNAMNVLGIFYESGLAVTQDAFEAISWYSKAAIKGHPHAQYNTARCFHDGFGADQNDGLAFAWFNTAASQYHVLSMLTVALCHEHGVGTAKNMRLAYNYYFRAVRRGSKEAKVRLESIIAAKILIPARILLNSGCYETETPGIQSLPNEILQQIIEMLDPFKILSRSQISAILSYAQKRRIENVSRRQFCRLVNVRLVEKVCSCKECKSLKHLMTTLEFADK